MKTFDSDTENNSLESYNTPKEITDLLIDSPKKPSTLQCNLELVQSYNVLKSAPMGHKGYFYQRVLCKNGISQDIRSQSMPSSLDDENKSNGNSNENADTFNGCDTDTRTKLLAEARENPTVSPTYESWCKTWPERKNDSCFDDSLVNKSNKSSNTPVASRNCDINCVNLCKNKITLNEALQNISLAYSPITKQLHRVETNDKSADEGSKCEKESDGKKLGHRRTEAGSFSSTVSSLSDPSPSGSLLDADERSLCSYEETGAKPKKKSIGNFFSRSVFNWKSNNSAATNTGLWKQFFGKQENGIVSVSPQHQCVIASSTALIQHARPSNLPAKTEEEEQRHREEYMAIIAAAKKREALNTANKQKQHKLQLQLEEQQAAATKHFMQTVLPNWETMCNTKKTQEMWWQGLPSSVRGRVWRLAIGNDLNLTPQLYEICLSRAQNRLNSPEPPLGGSDIDQESSMDVIQLDIARTFPHLGIFQEGGPYSEVLHSLLAAYVCYRPDVGYVQGMSYIAAILILNMEHYDAFICFANLLNQPLHLAAFTLNQAQMQAYYSAYNEVFCHNLPKLHAHFQRSGLTPDLYLLDWIYTIFAKAMPLDVACRVWDIFLRDGDEFIFRTALGILHLNQDILMHMDFLHGAQFLTRLPDDLSSEQLFRSIQSVSTNIGKQPFDQIVDRCCATVGDNV